MQEQARGGSRTTARGAERPERRGGNMSEDRLDKIINSAADHYNVPPVTPPFEQMWTAIEGEAFGRQIMPAGEKKHFSLVNNPWLRMAAVLVLGVAIGR